MSGQETAPITQKCPACGATIDTTNAEPLARVPCPQCGEKVRVERSFNNFVLVETLGVGGMGTVYKAKDTLLDRFVALKLLRKDLGEEIDYKTRLQQEARVAASVNHPNVIQVFSSGMDHDQFYLVMELVDHGSLDDFIEQRKRLPEEQVLETGIQVAKGLRAAHAKGLVHRDVKPANILFADEHTAKIGDFGLAGVAAEGAETRGEIWGTPYYVAPERLDNQPEDCRSDIYSLGATLFHAAAGKAPIQGETNSAVALRKLKNKPLDVRSVVPEVSAATARTFHRMLAPDPARRFSSYDELVRELEGAQRALRGQEVVDPNIRRRRRLWAIAASVVFLGIVGAGVFIWSRQQKSQVGATAAALASQAISAAELQRQYDDGRRQLLASHHKVAYAAFARLAGDTKNHQPLYDWVRLHQGLAALIGRERSLARQAFQEIQNAGHNGFRKEDDNLANFFLSTAGSLTSEGVIPGGLANQINLKNFEAFSLFLFALKDIEQEDAADAIPLLEQFVRAQPAQNFAWISDYKSLAQKYLEDCRSYAAWKNDPKQSSGDLNTRLENLRTLKKKLKMHSALSDEVSAQEKSLSQRVADQQKSQDAKREQEQKKIHDAELPGWNAALTNYKQKVMAYDFNGALDAAKAAKISDPTLREAQEAAQKKAQWLIDWKTKLMDDLNKKHFTGAITDLRGTQYSGVDGATAATLALKIPYGGMQAPWTNLAPKTLLAISASFAQANAPEAADRQWLCAVFAAETGQTEAARPLAESAAKSNPEIRDRFKILFP